MNLSEQSDKDHVADIYSKLANIINEDIRKASFDDVKYINLRDVNLPRNVLKRPIMTQTYSVTTHGIFGQLVEHFTSYKQSIGDRKITFYKVPSIVKGEYCLLTEVDLFKIAKIIDATLFKKYPLIKCLYQYIRDITNIMNKLDIPIDWISPNGIKIVQFYRKLKGKSKYRLSHKVAILNEYSDKLDHKKQSNAIIPNIIHSLDASHLMNVIIKMNKLYNKSIITVHDCFGTHPNNMESLSEIVKIEFAKLYTNEDFLNKFHTQIINNMRENGFTPIYEKKTKTFYVKSSDKCYVIPNPPLLGKFNLNQVKKSIYMIN